MDGCSLITPNHNPAVLVVHCVDTEGPIAGDVRRKPNGSQEFMGKWSEIRASLRDITSDEFRNSHRDALGNPYMFNWFIMDFMGFRTNPKQRIDAYNDTYDNIELLNTHGDSFHWHYHQPPKNGVGDQWSDDWDSSDEHYNILGHRLMHRGTFPGAYRAGGTIEDNKCSHWLEDNFMVDYSNRVSHNSYETSDIFDFNWYDAPDHWGFYHPNAKDFTKMGKMKRYIVRSVDAKSRFHTLSKNDVEHAFVEARVTGKRQILSYFSHDHRDMRSETNMAVRLIEEAAKRFEIPHIWCDATRAVVATDNICPTYVRLSKRYIDYLNLVEVEFSEPIYQKHPFVYTLDDDGTITYRKTSLGTINKGSIFLKRYSGLKKIGVACHSMSGNVTAEVFDPWAV